MPDQLSLYSGFAASGVFTWLVLNRLGSVRGDYAAVSYSLALTGLYAYFDYIDASSPLRLALSLLAAHVGSAFAAVVAYRLGPWHPLAKYPGPWWWWISSLKLAQVSYMGRRHFIVDDLHKKYGPYVRIGPDTMSINTFSAIKMYNSTQKLLEKSESYNTPGHMDRMALFFKQPRDLQKQRKAIWLTAFTPTAVSAFYPPLEKRTWELLACLERRQAPGKDGVVDLATALTHWAYDVMGEMVFGGANDLELMRDGDPRGLIEGGKMATCIVDSVGQSPWLMDLIWHLPFGRSMHFLTDAAGAMMRTRIQRAKDTDMLDLTSYLLASSEIPLKDLELDAVVAVQGGSDNTGTTMAIGLFFLLAAPHYYAKLQAELDATFKDKTGPLDWDTLNNLPWLNACINEALRLGSPFFLPRIVPRGGITLDGNFLPEHTIVALAAYSQQTSPEHFYPAPLEYRPDRWLPGGLGPKSRCNKNALASFSSGPYVCVAKAFAYQEMRYVLTRLVLTFDMRLPEGFDVEGFRWGILNMRTTMLQKRLVVHVERRNGVNYEQFLH